jgi:hypothetical protein
MATNIITDAMIAWERRFCTKVTVIGDIIILLAKEVDSKANKRQKTRL